MDDLAGAEGQLREREAALQEVKGVSKSFLLCYTLS